MIYFTRLIVLCWFVFLAFWFISAFGAKKNARSRSRNTSDIVRLIFLVLLVFVWQFPASHGTRHLSSKFQFSPALQAVGVIVCAIGVALAIWARVYLGRNWGMPMSVKENPELITSGPYQLVRHPIYTGVLLAMTGSVIVLGAEWFVPLAFYLIYFLFSARQEEKLMAKQFPNDYPAYRKRTKLLIPYLF